MFVGNIEKLAVQIEVPAMIFAQQAFCGAVIFANEGATAMAAGIVVALDLTALRADDDNRRTRIAPQLEITFSGKLVYMAGE